MARMLPSTERFHSRMAATNSAAIDSVRPRDSPAYSSSSDCPDQNCCSNLSASCRARRKANSFSMMMAQAQMEASSSPIMTNLTTGWAVMNSSKNEKPPVVAGLMASRGFIASIQVQMRNGRACVHASVLVQFGPGRKRRRPRGPAATRAATRPDTPNTDGGADGSRRACCGARAGLYTRTPTGGATAHAYALPPPLPSSTRLRPLRTGHTGMQCGGNWASILALPLSYGERERPARIKPLPSPPRARGRASCARWGRASASCRRIDLGVTSTSSSSVM